jgi:transposase
MSPSDPLPTWTEILHLGGFRVVHVRRDTPADPLRLTVVPTDDVGLCPHCHRPSATIHRRWESERVRDLPLGPQAVELTVRTYQFFCGDCQRYFTPDYPAIAPTVHATARFLEQAARLIRISDLKNAADFLQVPEKTLEDWYYDFVQRQQQAPPLRPIEQLGLDELHLPTATDGYAAVLIDHTNGRVLDVLDSRAKDKLAQYLRQAKRSGLLAGVQEITTDMWESYGEVAREVFGPGVRITIDRFHVMKNFQERLTAARRELQRRLPQAEAKALKGTRWLLLTNQENLTAAEQAELAALGERYPLLGQLRAQRDRLRDVFEDRAIATAAAGAKRLQGWISEARQLGLKALDSFCKTLETWLDKIANYFVSRASNGRVEGYNNGLRGILRRAYGMFNFKHFRLRVLDRYGRPQEC